MEVPFLNLKDLNRSLKKEILPLWEEILESSGFIGGEHVNSFETEFAEACSVKHCVAVGSGTDALRFILLGLDLKPGDEVITVANTFIATTEAISQAGGKVVFVDIDPVTYNMDASKLEAVINGRTKGILPVHLYGQCADMDLIIEIAEKNNLWVVEDACQAHLAEYKGRKSGSIGIAGAFSFYPGKNLGGCGEGGAVTTDDETLAQKIRMIRDHGQTEKYFHAVEGYNGRCDALQAAALRIKLRHLPKWNETRREYAGFYTEHLKQTGNIILPVTQEHCLHAFHLYVIQTDDRDTVQKMLFQAGISTGLHYPVPLHLQKAYEFMGMKKGSLPVTEAVAEKLLSLPMCPALTREQNLTVAKSLKNILKDNNVGNCG